MQVKLLSSTRTLCIMVGWSFNQKQHQWIMFIIFINLQSLKKLVHGTKIMICLLFYADTYCVLFEFWTEYRKPKTDSTALCDMLSAVWSEMVFEALIVKMGDKIRLHSRFDKNSWGRCLSNYCEQSNSAIITSFAKAGSTSPRSGTKLFGY